MDNNINNLYKNDDIKNLTHVKKKLEKLKSVKYQI
jgi:hypothetical protein